MIKDVVHITTFESIYQIVIMDILLELKKNYPALDIYCYRSPRNDTTAVLSDKFNIALLAFTPFENEEQESLNLLAKNHWQAEYIGEYQFVAFISSQNDLSKQADIALADLDNQTIAIPPETRYPYSQLVKSLNCKDILYIADKSSILSLVAKNSTISFFPSIRIKNNFYIENDLIYAKAIRDFPNVFHQYLIYPEKNLSQAELLVIDAIRSRHKQILS